MIAIALLALTVSTDLQPVGKWQLDYKPNRCTLGRSYGDKIFGIEWLPLSRGYKIFEFDKSIRKAPLRTEAVDMLITPGGAVTGFMSQYDAGEQGRLTTVGTEGDPAAMLETASAIRPVDQPDRSTYIITSGVQAARALRTCRDEWLRQMGQSVEDYNKIATPAQPINPETWIGPNDYPDTAIRHDQQGDSIIMWRIRTDGKVEDCKVAGTAGSKLLDEAACKALTAHGRYVPAKDAEGRPISSIESRLVQWRMPR